MVTLMTLVCMAWLKEHFVLLPCIIVVQRKHTLLHFEGFKEQELSEISEAVYIN